MTTDRDQMELELASTATRQAPRRPARPRRVQVARWWFGRMRETVRLAPSWEGGAVVWDSSGQVSLPLPTPTARLRKA